MLGVALSLIAFLAVMVLPGFGIMRLWELGSCRLGRAVSEESVLSLEGRHPAAAPLLAFAWSAAVLAVGGSLLVAGGQFDGAVLAALAVALALAGLRAFLRWARVLPGRWVAIAVIAALALPFVWSALRGNLAPTHSYQWYYWDLGRQLDAAGGVPSWVLEFGQQVRWHPDYVFSAFVTEAYRALTFPLDDAVAVTALRVPIAIAGLAALYLVYRLWLSRTPALIAVAATAATVLFIAKFNAYKPEALAIVSGLVAIWILVTGIRARRRSWLVLAGVLFGITVGMHGIAAAVTGVIAGAAAIVELGALERRRRGAVLAALAAAVACALTVVVATGVGLQGRAVVATDAAHPRVVADGDPTWTFLERHSGIFGSNAEPTLGSRIEQTVSHPWPGEIVGAGAWMVVWVALGVVCAVAWRRRGVGGRAALTVAAAAAVLVATMAFFALNFDTYIPQHTGVTRIGNYLHVLAGFGVGISASVAMAAWRRRGRRIPALALAALLAFFCAWAIRTDLAYFARSPGITENGRAALAELRERGGPGEAVLSNISTRGLIELETGLEAPIEGRQPVIEDPRFLDRANRTLSEVEAYFQNPGGPGLLRRLGVTWLLVSDLGRGIGSPFHFGPAYGQSRRFERLPYLDRVWGSGGLALFEHKNGPPPTDALGPPKDLAPPIVGGLAAVAGVIGFSTFLLGGRGFGRRSRLPVPPLPQRT